MQITLSTVETIGGTGTVFGISEHIFRLRPYCQVHHHNFFSIIYSSQRHRKAVAVHLLSFPPVMLIQSRLMKQSAEISAKLHLAQKCEITNQIGHLVLSYQEAEVCRNVILL